MYLECEQTINGAKGGFLTAEVIMKSWLNVDSCELLTA